MNVAGLTNHPGSLTVILVSPRRGNGAAYFNNDREEAADTGRPFVFAWRKERRKKKRRKRKWGEGRGGELTTGKLDGLHGKPIWRRVAGRLK